MEMCLRFWAIFATGIGLGAPRMFRPFLIRKAGKVPKEAGLDADAAGDENGGGRRSLYSTMRARTHGPFIV